VVKKILKYYEKDISSPGLKGALLDDKPD